jgi:hypothetical protein
MVVVVLFSRIRTQAKIVWLALCALGELHDFQARGFPWVPVVQATV